MVNDPAGQTGIRFPVLQDQMGNARKFHKGKGPGPGDLNLTGLFRQRHAGFRAFLPQCDLQWFPGSGDGNDDRLPGLHLPFHADQEAKAPRSVAAEFTAAHLQMSRMSGTGHGDKACLFRVQFLIRHDGCAQGCMQAGRHRICDKSCTVAGRIRHNNVYRVFHTSTPV